VRSRDCAGQAIGIEGMSKFIRVLGALVIMGFAFLNSAAARAAEAAPPSDAALHAPAPEQPVPTGSPPAPELPSMAPPGDDCSAVAPCGNRVLKHVESVSAAPNSKPDLIDLASITFKFRTQDFAEAHAALQWGDRKGHLAPGVFQAFDEAIADVEARIDAKNYDSSSLQDDFCYRNIGDPRCTSRLAGFAAAAFALNVKTYACGTGLVEYGSNKSGAFQAGYVEWWKVNGTNVDRPCVPPTRPPRCFVAWCFGGNDGYKYGVALRPSVELGGTFGSGLGFSSESGGASFQFSGSVGARFFMFDDAIDLHFGFGIAASTANSEASSNMNSSPAGAANSTKGFLVMSPGLGVWNGLFGINYIHTFDPFTSGRGTGNGVGISADVASVERIIEQK